MVADYDVDMVAADNHLKQFQNIGSALNIWHFKKNSQKNKQHLRV